MYTRFCIIKKKKAKKAKKKKTSLKRTEYASAELVHMKHPDDEWAAVYCRMQFNIVSCDLPMSRKKKMKKTPRATFNRRRFLQQFDDDDDIVQL